jgi:hypothetical protein
MRPLRVAVAGLAVSVLGAAAAMAAPPGVPPAAGRYDAQLCVTLSGGAPSCGAAEVDWQRNGSARVQVSDIRYRLRLHSSQVEVVMTHGAMQIDEFVSPFEWVGSSLQFADAARNARYELRLGERLIVTPRAART